jgi:hypothetical protein
MQKRIFAGVVFSIVASGCAGSRTTQNAVVDTSKKAFQAVYSIPGNFAYQTEKVYRDNAGRVRIEIIGQGPTSINVYDSTTEETLGWAVGETRYMRRPSSPMDPAVMWVNALKMPKKGGQELGARKIGEHSCHGYSLSGTEIWFDDDYGIPVQSSSGGLTMSLTQFTAEAPDASVFQPPPGYTAAEERIGHGFRHRRSGEDNSRILNNARMHMH